MPSSGWIGPCTARRDRDLLAGLVLEQIDGVAGMVPQQMVGPAARLAQRIHVLAAEEIGLHVHLLDVELARPDACLCTHWWLGLKRRVWPAMATRPVSFCTAHQAFGIGQIVGHRNFDHAHACRPACTGSAWSACIWVGVVEDRGLDAGLRQAFREIGRPVRDAEALGHLLGRVRAAAGQRHHFDIVDILQCVEMLDAEGALTGKTDLHAAASFLCCSWNSLFSRMMWPTPVDDAGTW